MDKTFEIDNIKEYLKNLIEMIIDKTVQISELKTRPSYSGSPAYDF